MQEFCPYPSIDFSCIEPVLSIVSSYLDNDSIILRRVCKLTRHLRASLECEIANRIPPNLVKFVAFQIVPSTTFTCLSYLKTIRLNGQFTVSTSRLLEALLHAPLEEFTCSVLLQADMGMDDFATVLLRKPLTTFQLNEYVTDAVASIIGEHAFLRNLAITLHGAPSALSEIAKCKSLREVRLEVACIWRFH